MAVQLGIVGAGTIGSTHVRSAQAGGIAVTAIADVNQAAAKALADANGIKHVFGDPRQMFASSEVNAVVVGVPNKFHCDLAIAAMEAGKDVFLEKPMAMNVAECRRINEVARRTGRILQLGFVSRHNIVAQTAKQMIESGRLGKIYHVKCHHHRRRGIPGLGGWFTTKSVSGGGVLIDNGPHMIDLVMYLLGFPKPTRASGQIYDHFGKRMKDYVFESMWAGPPKLDGTFDVEDSAHALIRFDNGATFELSLSWAGNFPDNVPKYPLIVLGDKGGIAMDTASGELRIATEQDGRNVDVIPKLVGLGSGYDVQMKAFAQSIQSRTAPLCTGEQGEMVQAVIDAIYRSSEQNREVEI